MMKKEGNLYQVCFLFFILGISGCSILAMRPVQEMSDTAAALQAARAVQADTLSPDWYRQASEWFFKAKQEYKFKNFADAKDYARKARRYAEKAEYDALKKASEQGSGALPTLSGMPAGSTSEGGVQPPAEEGQATPQPEPQSAPPEAAPNEEPPHAQLNPSSAEPTPTGTLARYYEEKKAEEEARKEASVSPSPSPSPEKTVEVPYFYPSPKPMPKKTS